MYRVLIADDEYWVGRWLADVLAKSPYDIKLAGISKNGGEALEKLKSDQIDILITDINMPVASGLALLKELEESGRKKPKTIIISGYDEFEYARQAIELDVLAYLLKPLEREKVYEAVEKAIGLLEEEQRQRESETSDFAGTVEVVLAEYLKNPESDLKEKLAELFCAQKGKSGFLQTGPASDRPAGAVRAEPGTAAQKDGGGLSGKTDIPAPERPFYLGNSDHGN